MYNIKRRIPKHQLAYYANRGLSPVEGWGFGKGGLFYKLPRIKGKGELTLETHERNGEYRQVPVYNNDDDKRITEKDLDDLLYGENGINHLNKLLSNIDNMDDEDRDILLDYIKKKQLEEQEQTEGNPFESVEEIDELLKDMDLEGDLTQEDLLDLDKDIYDAYLMLMDYKKQLLKKSGQHKEYKKADEQFDDALVLYEEILPELEEAEENEIMNLVSSEIKKYPELKHGKAFEEILRKSKQIKDRIGRILNIELDEIINNDENPNIPDVVKEYSVFDLSGKDVDIEAKNYNTKKYNISYKNKIDEYKILKNDFDESNNQEERDYIKSEMEDIGIDIQQSKFLGNSDFTPLYIKEGDKFKLYNVEGKKNWKGKTYESYMVNNDFNKNVLILANTADGIYYYNPLEDDDINFTKTKKIINGKEIYKMSPNFKTISIMGQGGYIVPITKWKKF